MSAADPGGDVVVVDALDDTLPLERVELFRGYPTLLLQAAAACCLLFVVVGVPGNLITIIALNRCKKVSRPLPPQWPPAPLTPRALTAPLHFTAPQ